MSPKFKNKTMCDSIILDPKPCQTWTPFCFSPIQEAKKFSHVFFEQGKLFWIRKDKERDRSVAYICLR